MTTMKDMIKAIVKSAFELGANYQKHYDHEQEFGNPGYAEFPKGDKLDNLLETYYRDFFPVIAAYLKLCGIDESEIDFKLLDSELQTEVE